MQQILFTILCGLIIGAANVIPGVSGGTMAVILGIYDKLINAISIKNLKKNFWFLVQIAAGAGIGILLLSRFIKYVYEAYPMATNFAFIGLILGSIPMIFRRAVEDKLKKASLIPFAAAFILMVVFAYLQSGNIANQIVEEPSLMYMGWLFAAGAISAFSMILPGVSGSFVMLLLGTYTTVIAAVSELRLAILIPVAVGCIIGVLAGAKLVAILLEKFPQQTYFAILGLIAGSLIAIFPGFAFNLEGLVSVLLLAVTAAGAYFFSKPR